MLRRDSSNSNSWSKIWLRVDSKTYGIDLVVTFESNGEKKIAKQVFLLQLRRLLSKFYCFCLADTVAVSLSFSLLLSLLQLQCHNPFLFQFAIVCGWERQCEEEREWERESIGLRLREGIQFPSVMAWLWGTAAALIRLGGSKFSSHNIQKWFFFSLLDVHLLTTVVRATINIITIINNFSLVCVCVYVRVRVFERERERRLKGKEKIH